MSTRGFIGFVIDAEAKIGYVHGDAYPEELGKQVYLAIGRWILHGQLDKRAEQARALRLVREDDKPTPEEVEQYGHYASAYVLNNGPADWYDLLRQIQGDAEGLLDAGVMPNGDYAPLDGNDCEWGYLINFDRRLLEVYRGRQTRPPTEGRWVGVDAGQRTPVQRILEFPFEGLSASAADFVWACRGRPKSS